MATEAAWASEEPAYKQIGTRKIMNTDFPVENKVMRTGPHQWTVLHLLCNGSWSGMRRFNGRRAAYADAGIIDQVTVEAEGR